MIDYFYSYRRKLCSLHSGPLGSHIDTFARYLREQGYSLSSARKYKRIVQVGTQNRIAPYALAAIDYLKSGKLGGIHIVKVYNLKSGEAFHLGDASTPPKGFDWDTWLGPAPPRPYHQDIFEVGWHKFWDFCGGLKDNYRRKYQIPPQLSAKAEAGAEYECSAVSKKLVSLLVISPQQLLAKQERGTSGGAGIQETGEKRKLAAFSESYDDPEKSNSYLLETAVEFSI